MEVSFVGHICDFSPPLVVPADEIEAREPLKVSLMPEGLLEQLSREEARDLVAYLASPAQVPLPAK
jgi:hypothetical protein